MQATKEVFYLDLESSMMKNSVLLLSILVIGTIIIVGSVTSKKAVERHYEEPEEDAG